MMTWFLSNPERLRSERASIEELRRSSLWLTSALWQLADWELVVDATLRVHDHDYEVRLSYPSLFPEVPAVVRPRNAECRWSAHQYGGPNGPLCLEYGPDNWTTDITGAMMIQSTQRLLEIENPLDAEATATPAPSRHALTLGQETRRERFRWFASAGFQAFLRSQLSGFGRLKGSLREAAVNWITLIHEATANGVTWKDLAIPAKIRGADTDNLKVGVWFTTETAAREVTACDNLAALSALAVAAGHSPALFATDGTSPVTGFEGKWAPVVVRDKTGQIHAFLTTTTGKIIPQAIIQPEESPPRLPEGRSIQGRKIGIVGLGSAGSKIAVSLARTGVADFCLVDHDVFLPENVVRNSLDWESVGEHKVNAVSVAIQRISPGASIERFFTHLSGQESNAEVGRVIQRLMACDLMIDASGNPRVFNLLAAAAKACGKPMVWLEVFGGGLGGLIGRSRPTIEPPPQAMRRIYENYCEQNPCPFAPVAERYGAQLSGVGVQTATDADVAIIAHHAARLAADTVGTSETQYPYSLYLIGLSKGWVFEAPFATIPIETPNSACAQTEKTSDELGADNTQFLVELLEKLPHGTPAAT